MKRAFFGGVHPDPMKQLSYNAAVVPFPAPSTVTIPMSQHIGAPCKPLVKQGDYVYMGQKIGDGTGLCVPVHASVSGKVKAVKPCPHNNGTMVMSVIIENDGEYTLHPDITPRTDPDDYTPQQLMDIIHEAGVAGMGGATFPTHIKMSSGIGKVDTIIINAAECEPYITADDWLLRTESGRVVHGIRLIMKIFGLNKAYIGMEANKPLAANALSRYLTKNDIELRQLYVRYPQGAEKQLIQAITGRQIPPGKLPADVGCAVFNAATCAAICDAFYDAMPLISRIVTVSGRAVMKPSNFLVPIGTSFSELIDAVGMRENPYKVLSGGPMMGVAQFDLSVPVVKGTNAVTVFGSADNVEQANFHCIRCGKCIDVCPMHLMPLVLHKAQQHNDFEALQNYHMMDCMECGCCAYTCPAKIPLVQSFRAAKQKLRDHK